jgi:hypothetical protein
LDLSAQKLTPACSWTWPVEIHTWSDLAGSWFDLLPFQIDAWLQLGLPSLQFEVDTCIALVGGRPDGRFPPGHGETHACSGAFGFPAAGFTAWICLK